MENKEIEKKFLIKKDLWNLEKTRVFSNFRYGRPDNFPMVIYQGYLTKEKGITTRVRLVNEEKAYLTIKGNSTGITKSEYEFEIPYDKAMSMSREFCTGGISKHRYIYPYKGFIWEIDEFLGDNSGLIIAEIELTNEEEVFMIPEFISEEVSNEYKYYNSNLISNPYKNWKV